MGSLITGSRQKKARKSDTGLAAPTGDPYPVPEDLDPTLKQFRTYWDSLKRGNSDIPFADDLKLGAIPELSGLLLLVTVFEKPLRFRVESAGREVISAYGGELVGHFADEILSRPPLDYFLSQCSATIAARKPTYYGRAPSGAAGRGYRRLLLPLWADGHIGALVGAVGG
jgi:hypothetical protein